MHNMQGDPEVDSYTLKPLTEWVSPFILDHLPVSTIDSNRIVDELIRVHTHDLEMIDYYSSYHTPYKWTSFEENIAFQISLLARCFTPTFRTDFSPFVPATRRQEGRGILKNPSLTGQSSTGSTNSSQSSDDEDSSSEDDSFLENLTLSAGQDDCDSSSKHISYNEIFPSMDQVYCVSIKPPAREDLDKYKKYAKMGSVLMSNTGGKSPNPKRKLSHNRSKRMINLNAASDYGTDDCWNVKAPTVQSDSIRIYEKYVQTPQKVLSDATSVADFDIICDYISSLSH